jgi:hypothetical protein
MLVRLTVIMYVYDFRGSYGADCAGWCSGMLILALLFCGLSLTVLNILDQSSGMVNSRAV